jgi:ribonuclease BN (tRNA processing enzyme)
VELTVLGSSGAWPGPGRAASGYLLRHDRFHALLDLGPGVLSAVQRHVPHDRIDALLISHEHPDHCLDLYMLFTARRFHGEPLPPLAVYAPPGVFERVAALEDAEGVAEMQRVFDVREVGPGADFETGPLVVSTRLLPHWVPNMGMRIEADGVVLAYTGDTGPSEEIEALARGADLLLAEASWQDSGKERPPFHLTARQAAEHAARAEAPRLMLTHFWPSDDREVSRRQAEEAFRGELVLADEGVSIQVAR